MTIKNADRFQRLIIDTFPEGLIDVPEGLESVMTNHYGDRHVLAAAVFAKADIIVTHNIKHFKSEDLQKWNVEAVTPDLFLNSLCDLYGVENLCELIQSQADALRKPPQTFLDLIQKLEKEQPLFASRLLLHKYGEMIKNVARKLQYIWKNSKNPSVVTSKKYRIESSGTSFSVLCQINNREVIVVNLNKVSGNIFHRDVIIFQEMAKELFKEGMIKAYMD